jgi:hypothetical protein
MTTTTTTTTTTTEERESLKFKLQGSQDYDLLVKLGDAASQDDLGSWGHEFVRSLAGEIGQEYNARVVSGADPAEDGPFADLLAMVDVIVPFNVAHNSEAEAVDLLIEVQRLKKILDIDSIDEKNYRRVCMYLIKTADFMSDPDDYTVSCPVFSNVILGLFRDFLVLIIAPHRNIRPVNLSPNARTRDKYKRRRSLNRRTNYSSNNPNTSTRCASPSGWGTRTPYPRSSPSVPTTS